MTSSNSSFKKHKLSKSTFLMGRKCEKYLYLFNYKKNEITPPDTKTKVLFNRGHQFEDHYRKTEFPNGINITDKGEKFVPYAEKTKQYLENTNAISLFEATIIENEVLVMVDVLDKKSSDEYHFYEVKLNQKINDVIWEDLTIQYYVCKKRYGDKIASFNVVLRKNIQDWTVENLQLELEKRIIGIEDKIAHFKTILTKENEPTISMGAHCEQPYKCVFMKYCQKERSI